MIVVLTAKVPGLSEASGESVLCRTLDQLVASHLGVVVRRCSSRCCAVMGAGGVGRMMHCLVHARPVGGGSWCRAVARH